MHPVLIAIPIPFTDVTILIYSVFFAITLSLVLAILLGTRAAEKLGLPVEIALNMTLFGLIALILGARFYAFCENPAFYLAHPMRLMKLWEGSLATYGGAIGGVLGCIGYLFFKRQPVFRFLDAYAPYGFLGLGIIRVGDFLNGTAFGKPSGLPWAVGFPKGSFAYDVHLHHGWIQPEAQTSLPVHPTQLYEAMVCFLAFLALLLWSGSKKRMEAGQGFLRGSLLYVGCRFFIDSLRDDLPRNLPFGLASTQWVGVCAFFLLLCFDVYLSLNSRKPRPPSVPTPEK